MTTKMKLVEIEVPNKFPKVVYSKIYRISIDVRGLATTPTTNLIVKDD
jgi:hypothetical protein